MHVLTKCMLLFLPLIGAENSAAKAHSILDEPQCSEVKRLCTGLSENEDILVLECLQSLDPYAVSKLNDECQHVVWDHMKDIISNDNVREFLLPTCKNELQNIDCQVDTASTGSYLKCIVNKKDGIESHDCLDSIVRLENVAFYDYRWIANFIQHCEDDIRKLSCGRIDQDKFSQAETVACLQNKYTSVNDKCRTEIFKLSEIQADSIKLDRQLYLACAEDQMRWCRQFPRGSGRVYNCLMQHRHDSLTSQCQNHLLRRQKLISQDYRISRGLMRSCRDDIKKTHCRPQTSDDKAIRLAQVLICLEGAHKNGTKIDPDCEAEMSDQRKILLEDFRLSPEIVGGCADEIRKFCGELQVGGKTIHCLMDHARLRNVKKRIGDVCQRELESLLKAADVGEDWRVDPVLHEACNPVVQAACKDVRDGNARVMSCLMDNVGADHMTEDCENALIQIQYFVARDFKLDPQLYRACKDDATRFCHASQNWDDKDNGYDAEAGPLILPCLYRYAYNEDKNMQLKDQCFDQIKRVMRQRSLSVDLIPEIEDVCMDDLSMFCLDKTAKGQEMYCLQENLDKLDDKCKDTVEKYTENEAQNVELNPYIMSHCRQIIDSLCPADSKQDSGNVMDCLIAHKNDPLVKSTSKCRISIEHFQLISLKDFRFSYKFKAACKPYAVRFCHAAKTKADVVGCLSEKVTNDTIAGVKSDIQKECRQQLKVQLFQQRENIQYDPKLDHACKEDIKKHCSNVERGSAQVLECLQATAEEMLSEKCQVELFKVKKQDLTDNSVDYALMTMCADSIQMFCSKVEPAHVLDCLKRSRDEKGFSKKCLAVVKHRIVEQNSDYRLNPSLHENCRADIKKFCLKEAMQAKPEKQLNGLVINCLKRSFKQFLLSNRCEKELSEILRDQALDLQLNPLLRTLCTNELETICRQEAEDESGNAEECLKNALLNKKIPSPECQNEVATLIEESQADIHVDPLLQQTCALDLLKYCSDVVQGNGRHIKCLKLVMKDSSKPMSEQCKGMLEKRLNMYRAAELKSPEDFRELYNQIAVSPLRNYCIVVILVALAMLFLMGMQVGRTYTRRSNTNKKK